MSGSLKSAKVDLCMNVLSLFNGISCGQIALQSASIKVDKYFASEIDKHAIKVTQYNWPETIQLGDVTKWRQWDIDWSSVNLLLAGFPCQAWSICGKQQGVNDPRGALAIVLFELFDFLKKKNPNLKFLFENVKMKKIHVDYLNGLFGVEPIEIDSSLVSAQSRKRLYWTNIPFNKTFPRKDVFLSNILQDSVDLKYFLTNNYKLKSLKTSDDRLLILSENYRVKYKTGSQKPVLVSEIIGDTPSGRSRQTDRLYSSLSKSPTLTANRSIDMKIDCGSSDFNKWRTLTSLEVERLQTVPEDYTSCIPEPQRFKCLGNGWTVDVIAHIFKGLA